MHIQPNGKPSGHCKKFNNFDHKQSVRFHQKLSSDEKRKHEPNAKRDHNRFSIYQMEPSRNKEKELSSKAKIRDLKVHFLSSSSIFLTFLINQTAGKSKRVKDFKTQKSYEYSNHRSKEHKTKIRIKYFFRTHRPVAGAEARVFAAPNSKRTYLDYEIRVLQLGFWFQCRGLKSSNGSYLASDGEKDLCR